MAETYGMMYLRFPRKEKGSYYKGTEELTIGKGAVVREGTDAAVIASGIEVKEALKAAEVLEEKGFLSGLWICLQSNLWMKNWCFPAQKRQGPL